MKLRSKLILPIIAITAAMSTLTAYLISDHIEQDALARAQHVTAEYIIAKTQAALTAENFQDRDFQAQKPVFQAFLKQITTPDILKIKVFNSRFDIIYSTADDDIGKKTDSSNYRRSLQEGLVVASIKPPLNEKANIELYGYRQLMEVYIPISYNDRIEGVIEAYFKMDAINRSVSGTTRKVIVLIILLALSVCIILYAMLTAMVVRPLRMMTQAAEKAGAGTPDAALRHSPSRDELGALQNALARMIASGRPQDNKRF